MSENTTPISDLGYEECRDRWSKSFGFSSTVDWISMRR